MPGARPELREPTDFGEAAFPLALVNITNVCNLECSHCFVFRDGNPNSPRDKMDDANMLHQLTVLRDRHGIRSMLFMGGEPMIRKDLVMKAVKLFESPAIVTNGTYGIPSLPGGLVTVSLDGPEALNDAIRGEGVFAEVKKAIFACARDEDTTLMIQMAVTRQNAPGLEAFVEAIEDWPIDGVAFSFYVPRKDDRTGLAWDDLRERDRVLRRVIALKLRFPDLVKTNVGALELMMSERCAEHTGPNGEHCLMKEVLPLYMGDGGRFERTFCCYGNDVDCLRCGAYSVFNTAYQRRIKGEVDFQNRETAIVRRRTKW